MTSPTGPDQNHPQGQPGYGAPQQPPAGYNPPGYGPAGYEPAPGYGPAPAYSGGPAATGQRPGMVTAAAIVGIVWGGLGTLGGLLGLLGASALDDLGVRLSGLDMILGLLGIVAAVLLLVGGIQVLQGKAPKLLKYGAYAVAVLWALNVIAGLIQGYGFAGLSLLSLLVAGVIIALLMNAQSKQYYSSRGIQY
jgi:hypothetical protein